jgi:serine phosphatase RsbU (regulator of sigma subunit)/anti-sigma regulatory factor (Ser/Thr protein kinase)/PAS domain-containing protein
MTMSEHATHRFAPQATSAAAARRFVRETLTGWAAEDVLDDAVLLTSELVTNAVVHAGTELSVSCALGPGYVQVGVTDSHGSRLLPTTVTNPAPDKTSGRGLYLMMQISQSWGVEYENACKRVWFRLPLPFAAPPASTVPARPGHFVELGRPETPVRVAVVEADVAGVVRHWGAEAEAMLGWPAADVLGRPLADLVSQPPEIPENDPPTSFADVLAQPRWSGDYRMRVRNGDELAVFASHMHVSAGEQPRIVILLVQAEHRALLASGPSQPPPDRETPSPVPARPDMLSLDALLNLAVEHSRDLLDGDVAYALLVTDDDLEVELRALTGLDRAKTGETRWPKPPELSGSPDSVQAAVYPDIAQESLPERFLADAGVHAVVTAPLLVGERVIGRVGVAVRRVGGLTEADAARLRRSISRFSLAVESARLTELERIRRGRLSYLAEASDLLAGMLDPDMAAALTAQLVVPRLADWCAVYLVDRPRTAHLSCVWHARENMIDPLRRLLQQVPPPPLEESGRPRQWPALRELLAGHASSPADVDVAGGPTVTVTLLARGRAIGTLIAGRAAGEEFRTGALDTLDDLCRRASWALDNARLYQERCAISDALQRSLLPVSLPSVPGLDVGIAYEAAGEGIAVGGDFYDVFEIDSQRWGFVVGDVCGKGAEAAAVTGLARHSLRALAREHENVPTVLRRLNATILADGETTRFVTLVYGELVETPGGVAVTFAAAGHPLPTLVNSDGSARVVGRPQSLLGVFQAPVFHTDTLHIRRGQHLVCTTDGVTDRRIGHRTLGEPGLQAVLRQTATLPASAVATRLRQAVLDFGSEPLQDDFAVLVLQPVGGR